MRLVATVPSGGPFQALRIARQLEPELAASTRSTAPRWHLPAIRAAFALDPERVDAIRGLGRRTPAAAARRSGPSRTAPSGRAAPPGPDRYRVLTPGAGAPLYVTLRMSSAARGSVLVVDDEPTVTDVLSGMLPRACRLLGHVAADGPSALEV